MAVEAIAAASGAAAGIGGKTVALGPATPLAPDAVAQGRFDAALARAAGPVADMPQAVKGLLGSLDAINGRAQSVSEYARTAEASGATLTPGEIVQLTMQCQEFLFQAQLTSNIANRSADGVQQLFRQQG